MAGVKLRQGCLDGGCELVERRPQGRVGPKAVVNDFTELRG
jgi:hypothetical protein